MKLECFSLFDDKAKIFGTPFFAINSGIAVRMLTDLVNDPKSTVSRYPEDFTLYRLGEFSDDVGSLKSPVAPEPIGKAVQFKQSVQ